jgi:hypothetical protein
MTEELELLKEILAVLQRIEIIESEKQNKTQESKDARELMQGICKYYRDNSPSYNVVVGSKLHMHRFRYAICKIKNFRNTKLETRKLYKWIRILEDREFIQRDNSDMIEVLDTGTSWWE